MYQEVIQGLDRVAEDVESKGLLKEALDIDTISDILEKEARGRRKKTQPAGAPAAQPAYQPIITEEMKAEDPYLAEVEKSFMTPGQENYQKYVKEHIQPYDKGIPGVTPDDPEGRGYIVPSGATSPVEQVPSGATDLAQTQQAPPPAAPAGEIPAWTPDTPPTGAPSTTPAAPGAPTAPTPAGKTRTPRTRQAPAAVDPQVAARREEYFRVNGVPPIPAVVWNTFPAKYKQAIIGILSKPEVATALARPGVRNAPPQTGYTPAQAIGQPAAAPAAAAPTARTASYLDSMADVLEEKGYIKEAMQIDMITNALEEEFTF